MGVKLSISVKNEQHAYLLFLQEQWEERSLSAVIQSIIYQHAETSGYEFVPATFRLKTTEN